MTTALYGPGGFFVTGAGPAAHFRTSAHAAPAFARALLRLLERLDAALGWPARLDLVDVGAGRGELLSALVAAADPELAGRLRPTAVELSPRPEGLPGVIGWRDDLPSGVTGLLLATEWLDNVPLEVAARTPDGWRRVLVDPATGEESLGGPVDDADAHWLDRWWPAGSPATDQGGNLHAGAVGSIGSGAGGPTGAVARAEVGLSRDTAWADAVDRLDRGLAVAVDYGHLRQERPSGGTLTGYRGGRQVPPVPDGSCDVTAHVAVDSVAEAGAAVAGRPYTLVRQREALRALGVDGRRPPLALAGSDPAGYVRALATASAAAELTDPAGLGGHWWLLQPVGVDMDPVGL
jgi:SAM-dependent MidA family methyltransferase